jgi:tripeptide aminopeptidase
MTRLFETFIRLCEIRSPTGEEREIADTLAAELRALGYEVSEDEAAGPADAGAGNLLARLPGTGEEWAMFCAHIDTVPHKGQVEVVDDEGVYRSRGETILGADNKAAVAVFIELAARHAEKRGPVGIELVLTVAEEQGLRGAKAFDPSALRSRVGFVLDHAGPVGEVIETTPTQQKILADFHGVEAHAGIRPEDGSSAIAAAAAAITRMDLGRLDEGTTANVGLIAGGTSGNVVPGHCGIHAEARSLDAERAAEVAGKIADACAWGASEHNCDVDVRIEELFRGYRLPKDSPALGFAEAGLRAAGVEPVRVAIGGGSDANALRLDGYDSVLLANGPANVHTSAEMVSKRDLEKMLEVCEAIAAAVGEAGAPADGAAAA